LVDVSFVHFSFNLHVGIVVILFLWSLLMDVEEAVVGSICLVVLVQQFFQRSLQDLDPFRLVRLLSLESVTANCPPVDLAVA
jgi:hypothetical protein